MRSDLSLPLAGFFRVLYFTAATTVSVAVVATGVTTFSDPPSPESQFPAGFEEESFERFEDQEADFRRDTGLALSLIGTAGMGVAILGLGSRFNALRSGLLLGGILLFISGAGGFDLIDFGDGYVEERSDEWLNFVVSCVAFLVVIGSARWIDDGLPLKLPERHRPEPPAPTISGPMD